MAPTRPARRCLTSLTRRARCSARVIEGVVLRLLGYVERSPQFIRHCFHARDWSSFDVVGFSSTFGQNVSSLALARLIREHHPGTRIVFGGANCEGEMGRQLLRSFPWVDGVIQGEADFALPEFMRRLRTGECLVGVPGVVMRDGADLSRGADPVPVRDMDALPVPDFDDYFEQLPGGAVGATLRAQLALPIETSRGCWWGAVSHCTFCGLNPTTMTFRSKSPGRAVSELRQISRAYRTKRICAVDNIINNKYFRDVLPRIEADGFEMFYETKSNLKEAEVRQLARSGVTQCQPGVEGLSSEILALMRKGVKGYQNVELLKWCATYHVIPTWFYLYRFPHEPHEPYWRDIGLMDRLVHLPPPRSPNPVTIDRYSPLFTHHEQFGLTDLRPWEQSSIAYRGLPSDQVFNISYHFQAELPQGSHLPYVRPLWTGVLNWHHHHSRGARFFQFEARGGTLLVDTRRGRGGPIC